jgi:hypothetical protein
MVAQMIRLDPHSENFKWQGEVVCKYSVAFISPKGYIFWVPHHTLKVFMAKEKQENKEAPFFSDWYNTLSRLDGVKK